MSYYPVLLSVVFVVRNQSRELEAALTNAASVVSSLVSDYELIIVDNASTDESVATLKGLTSEKGLPNLQVYALTKEVDTDTACWVGLENALGDFVAVIDPLIDDINFLPAMLEHAAQGMDVVFAINTHKPIRSFPYKACFAGFNALYKRLGGVDLANDAPQYRLLSKRVVNFILQHPVPAVTYRHLPATAGFAQVKLSYSAKPKARQNKHLKESIERGIRLLVSTTRAPMRFVSVICLFGAAANLLYSAYVIVVGLIKADVAPGWVTLSLQQSGMFFLLSLALLVLGEYIVQMVTRTNEGPAYHVAQEFTSAIMTRREKLNIEVVDDAQAAEPKMAVASHIV
ncbi:glycosyltransferase involved in cell wall biosynthesis [Pseudomonas duriflava]|uniref:Glycosyltransferase involved in cell wall biosynthesis n=1 Tax=Pseudomonas duriflava TaxID=459528 RepID=A0A562Q9Y6_9PSED|nr:glycosyltransferase [Pseudomonas duriflava]TWI53548.1 glycosyltransferase involved in cell wall biosynthesis [Pseudomonas duriflava]